MQHVKSSFLRWWLLACLQAVFLAVVGWFGIYQELWTADQTRLSFVILAVYAISTAYVGLWHANFLKMGVDNLIKIGWFLSEAMLAIGMIGTVAGFLLMLGSTFKDIDVANVASLQHALTEMALGMSTALYTTLTGLVASLFLKSQLVNLEHLVDHHEDHADTKEH